MKIDIDRLIGAVTREISIREVEGQPARILVASRGYETTIDDLWDAVTNAERIASWFLPITGDLRLGGRYQLEGNAGGEITKCEPPRQLNLTWEFGGQMSWVNLALTSDPAGGTVICLEHIAHVPEDFWNQYGPGATGVGWELGFLGLDLHLAKEAEMGPKEAEAWLGTDEGKKLIRQSSEAWCQASMAAGTEASAAVQAAKNTTEFYGGNFGSQTGK